MLSFAVFVTLLASAMASTPLIAQSHVQRVGKGFSYTTMTGHPAGQVVYPGQVGSQVVYPGQYAAGSYPYAYNTYPYNTGVGAYPYTYNQAVVGAVPAVSTVGVKPIATNPLHYNYPYNYGMPVQTNFVQGTAPVVQKLTTGAQIAAYPHYYNYNQATFPHVANQWGGFNVAH